MFYQLSSGALGSGAFYDEQVLKVGIVSRRPKGSVVQPVYNANNCFLLDCRRAIHRFFRIVEARPSKFNRSI